MEPRRTRIVKMLGLPEITRTSRGTARVIDATSKPAPRVPPRSTKQRSTVTTSTMTTTSPIRRKSLSPKILHMASSPPPPPQPTPPCQHLVEEVSRLGEQVSLLSKQLSQLLEISRHSEPPMSRHQPSPAPSSSRSRSHHQYYSHHERDYNHDHIPYQHRPQPPSHSENLLDVSMASHEYLRRNNLLNI